MRKAVWLVLLLTLAIGPAHSVVVSGFNPAYIEIDGNITRECTSPACTDWLDRQATASAAITDQFGNNDGDILSPGSTLSAGSTLPKQDITHIYLSNNNDFLYVAEERRANNGNSGWHLLMTKEAPTFIPGQPVVFKLQNLDIDIRICFPKGSDPAGKSIEVWQVINTTTPVEVEAADIWSTVSFRRNDAAVAGFEVNTAITDALAGALDSKGVVTDTYDIACFAEAAIGLDALELDSCGSQAYATVITRSSCSLTSDVKDIAGPVLYSFGGPTISRPTASVDCANQICFSAAAGAGTPPYTYRWFDNSSTTPFRTFGPTANVIDSFCGTLPLGDHDVTCKVTDSGGCIASDTAASFTVYSILDASLSGSAANCGVVTWTATPSGGLAPYSYAWTVDGSPVTGSTNTLSYGPNSDCVEHEVCVTVSDSRSPACTKKVCRKITQSVSTAIP